MLAVIDGVPTTTAGGLTNSSFASFRSAEMVLCCCAFLLREVKVDGDADRLLGEAAKEARGASNIVIESKQAVKALILLGEVRMIDCFITSP